MQNEWARAGLIEKMRSEPSPWEERQDAEWAGGSSVQADILWQRSASGSVCGMFKEEQGGWDGLSEGRV